MWQSGSMNFRVPVVAMYTASQHSGSTFLSQTITGREESS